MNYFYTVLKNVYTVVAVVYSKLGGLIGKKIVLMQGFIQHKGLFGIKKANCGDDINKFFFEYATNCKVIMLPGNTINPKRFLCIGSILDMLNLENATIFGSGVLDPDIIPVGTPEKIISVRGPLTRKWLMDNGMVCPETYGDPALLLPLYYHPQREKTEKPILIPHYETMSKKPEFIFEIAQRGRPSENSKINFKSGGQYPIYNDRKR